MGTWNAYVRLKFQNTFKYWHCFMQYEIARIFPSNENVANANKQVQSSATRFKQAKNPWAKLLTIYGLYASNQWARYFDVSLNRSTSSYLVGGYLWKRLSLGAVLKDTEYLFLFYEQYCCLCWKVLTYMQ